MKNTFFNALLVKHQNQLTAFETMRIEAWKGLQQQEKDLLQREQCDYHNAPYEVWLVLERLRNEFQKNWGNDGRLIKELNRWQMREVQKIITEQS
jgi:hypothetical protein